MLNAKCYDMVCNQWADLRIYANQMHHINLPYLLSSHQHSHQLTIHTMGKFQCESASRLNLLRDCEIFANLCLKLWYRSFDFHTKVSDLPLNDSMPDFKFNFWFLNNSLLTNRTGRWFMNVMELKEDLTEVRGMSRIKEILVWMFVLSITKKVHIWSSF